MEYPCTFEIEEAFLQQLEKVPGAVLLDGSTFFGGVAPRLKGRHQVWQAFFGRRREQGRQKLKGSAATIEIAVRIGE